ncbi:unnamed protein product [Heligmosomoides polygyrus]|uniref:LOB domain-containing protein n=1 Tax=Heligmosomoides polygyrus TaxID=6339 RepID=A0A183FZA0_HELPZ|nr:unnamed protein product [Heligmosomoides polygyrus]
MDTILAPLGVSLHACSFTGHQIETQAIYNRCYLQSSVYAYAKLKRYADEDASNNMSRLLEVEHMIRVIDLKIANQFIVVERRVQELEEDDGRQSVVSSAEALRQRHRRHDADIDISDEEAIDLDLYPRVAERLAPGDE